MTASEFEVHTRILAYELATQASVQLNDTVGLCLERSEKELVGIVGIWRIFVILGILDQSPNPRRILADISRGFG